MSYAQEVESHFSKRPVIPASAFVAPGATVIGDVTLGEEASIWYGAVLRGDINRIRVGAHSNIQDGSVVHIDSSYDTTVGEWVTVGHRAILHACTVADEVLVGMGSIILDGAEIGARSIIGAGALVTGGKKIPPGSLVLGSPGKVVRELTEEEQLSIKSWAERYVLLSRRYLAARG
jgi:carbonic anhydrase/acetyltransferase-like protein (isoleucine patch superfamily)